jgi:type VI secretion system protein ImpK
MAAFSDEVVLNSRWEKKYDWMAKPLAIQFFGDSAIGQNFFVRLDELRQSFDEQFDIIQLYFSVLILGFQGKYRLEGFEKLQAYISTLRTDIEKRLGNVPRTLSDAASPESQMSSRIAGRQPYWVMAVMLVALTLIMTIFYSTKVQSAISNSAQKIEVMAQAENAHSSMVETLPESELEQEVAQ